MGNRATVIFTDGRKSFSPAVYLHWNGGPESIYGFLAELDRRGARADQDYEAARFVQLVGEFFDQEEQGTLSLGITNGPTSWGRLDAVRTDHSDNGFYLVNRTRNDLPVMRRFVESHDPMTGTYGLRELSMTKVAQEADAARQHEYADGLAEAFQKIANGREVGS